MYLNTGEVVRGVIRSVYPNEIIVDLGTKCTGYVNSSDIDSDKISIGDEKEFIIIKVSDADGTCYLEEKEHYMKRKNMIDNNTIKEICDVVTEEVMKRIRQELSAMKPGLIQEITEASTAKAIEEIGKTVDAQNSTTFQQLQQKIEILEKHMPTIEMQISGAKTINAKNIAELNNQLQQKIEILEKRISQLEMQIKKLSAPQPKASTKKIKKTISDEEIEKIMEKYGLL